FVRMFDREALLPDGISGIDIDAERLTEKPQGQTIDIRDKPGGFKFLGEDIPERLSDRRQIGWHVRHADRQISRPVPRRTVCAVLLVCRLWFRCPTHDPLLENFVRKKWR